MTNLNNAIKENEYRKEAGLNKDDDKNNKLLLKFIDNNNDLLKKFIEYPERKLLTYKEEKKDDMHLKVAKEALETELKERIEDIGKLNDEKNFIEKLKNNVVTELSILENEKKKMDKEIEESKNKNIKYKIANEAVIKTQINKIHEHEKKAEEYLKQLEELEDKSKNLIKFIKKKDEELEVKKFDIDIITRKLENKNIELENKDNELNKKKNELKNIKFDSVASRKNLIKYLQDEKNIDQIDGKKFTDSGEKYLSIEEIKKYYLDNFSRSELLKYFSKSEDKPGEDIPIERKKIKKIKDEEEKKQEEKKDDEKQEEKNEYSDFALKTEELKNKAGNETKARETGDDNEKRKFDTLNTKLRRLGKKKDNTYSDTEYFYNLNIINENKKLLTKEQYKYLKYTNEYWYYYYNEKMPPENK